MLLQPLFQAIQLNPDALAVQDDSLILSYRQLAGRITGLSQALRHHGLQAGQRVAILLPRGAQAMLAALAVVQAGACYVPLDVKNPAQRLAFIVADADVALIIGEGTPPPWLPTGLWWDITASEHRVEATDWADFDTAGSSLATDLAAILYTSGSTGSPRGVALSHGAIRGFADWARVRFALSAQDRVASSAPLFFDLSTFDLFAVLASGASLHVLPQALTLAPARLSAWLAEQRISGWYTVPSQLAFLAYKGNLSQTALPQLRWVLFAGEVFATPALRTLAERWPTVALYNLFGPTETNVCCYWPVERARLLDDQPIPIGYAAAGCELKADADQQLWVRGVTVAAGYWSQGRLQAITDGDGWYATGDRVSQQHGQWHFHGRIGRMLKCAGYRVEPAEIEAVLQAIEGVRACAVLGIVDAAAGQRIAAALVLEDPSTLPALRQIVMRSLPGYMQPSRYCLLPELPLLSNGKLDYQTLLQLMESAA